MEQDKENLIFQGTSTINTKPTVQSEAITDGPDICRHRHHLYMCASWHKDGLGDHSTQESLT